MEMRKVRGCANFDSPEYVHCLSQGGLSECEYASAKEQKGAGGPAEIVKVLNLIKHCAPSMSLCFIPIHPGLAVQVSQRPPCT
jgi:hypothetical protein